ncbi:exonuclease domain-containing protein [Bacillus dakarensis]|uniref:exonuclease domain-containing protein n=1 Tax=Robertmurraya dakarensis TaxID=1926278 RepID=UPI0009809F8B|nr:exonuclease domain-containing protein [Bacillus dakarensis]
MAFEPFIRLLRGIQGKPRLDGLGDIQNSQQIAFLRRMQKEMDQEDSLKVHLKKLDVVVFDIETTGFFPNKGDEIISIGAVKITDGEIKEEDTFYSLVHCEKELPPEIEKLTGITSSHLKEAPMLSNVFVNFLKYVQGSILVAHHANHERSFLQSASWKLFRTPFKHRIVDTSFLFRVAEPELTKVTLEDLCEHIGIPVTGRHHALEDAKLTAKLWEHYARVVTSVGCETLHDVYSQLARNKRPF